MKKQILVTRSSLPTMEEYVREISSIWENHWLTNMGEKHQALQTQLSKYLGVKHTSLFTNGHAALECILETLELEGEVITTPYTFTSTTNAIVRKNLSPVFCDINPIDFNIDVEKIEALITPRTCAIVPVHVYGNPCNVEAIERIAAKHGLKVIYDAAHAFGVKKNGIPIGQFGDASMFSFHATKVFNTIEGGAVVFSDDTLEEKLNRSKNFGISGPENVVSCGSNAKMNEFCAAMGLCNLRHVQEAIESRKRIVDLYNKLLSGIPGIQLNVIAKNVESNYAYYPIVIHPEYAHCSRDDIFTALAENHIGARKYFYPLTSQAKYFQGKINPEETPVALRVSQRVLTLPLYEGLESEAVKEICSIIRNCVR